MDILNNAFPAPRNSPKALRFTCVGRAHRFLFFRSNACLSCVDDFVFDSAYPLPTIAPLAFLPQPIA